MADVHIIDKRTGKTATIIRAHIGGMNYVPNSKEWEDDAWKAAVEDGDVQGDQREHYEFKFVEEKQ